MQYEIKTHKFDGQGITEQMRTLPGNRIVFISEPPTERTGQLWIRTTVADVHFLETVMNGRFKALVLAIDGPEYMP